MSDHDARWLWERWIDLWNWDLALAKEIIHPDFNLHRIPPPRIPYRLAGREGLLAWINQTRSLLSDLRFEVEVGPIVEALMAQAAHTSLRRTTCARGLRPSRR